MASEVSVVIGAFRGPTPEQVRIVAEREGWQMPLAPFVADGDQLALVRTLGGRKRC